jgi:5-methylcytosine-specific restriction protein A
MPPRPKTICRKVACGALIDAPGYCAKHTQQSSGWARSNGGKTSTERGYDYAWQKTRERILSRDSGLCQIKSQGCTFVAKEVDHKVSKAAARAAGWTEAEMEAESNLQAACPTCHKSKTAAERGGRV